ncbi:MAG: RNA-binding protein [Bacillota bacterium]
MITTVEGLRYGQLVRSTAGRDRNRYYLILGLLNDHFIEVVDGFSHPVAKAKKKNLKHVKVLMLIAREIEEKVLKGESIADSQISSAIKRLQNELEEGERFDG